MPRYTGTKRLKMETSGFDEVKLKLGAIAADLLKSSIETDVANGVRKMTVHAYKNAPVETGALRTSILGSINKEGDMEYIFGSYMPYAQRQEFEHKTHRMFLHNAARYEKKKLHKEILGTVKRQLK